MVTLLILFFLLIGVMSGFRRGIIRQLGHMISIVASLIVATLFYEDFAEGFKLWIPYPSTLEGATIPEGIFDLTSVQDIEMTFYNIFWFVVLFFATKLVLQLMVSLLDSSLESLLDWSVIKELKAILGGVFGFVEAYILIFFILWVVAFIPSATVQTALEGSWLASLIVEHTVILSDLFSLMVF